MSFYHFYLLGGLSLVAVPILIHLVTREKPKHLLFPAFRFLQQKYLTSRRKLRFHHLLLMLLRMALIAALVLALAQPRLYSDRLTFLGGTQPVAVVLLFDTSSSMEYDRAGVTRLEDARTKARELLQELPDGSKVALLDSAEAGGEFSSVADVRDRRLPALKVRPDNYPVSRLLSQAERLFAQEEEEARQGGGDPPPRYLYVFSDRTRASWDASQLRGFKLPEGVNAVLVDVGIEKPADLAIERVIIDPPAVVPGGLVRVQAVVQALGEKADCKITCQIDNDPRLQDRLVQLEEGGRQLVTFEYRAANPARPQEGGLAAGTHQVTLRIDRNDNLPFNNVRHGTFLVRPGRKVLTVMDTPDDSQPWPIAVDVLGFNSSLKSAREAAALPSFREFDLVCLHQLSDPTPLWGKVEEYVNAGGKVAVIPGGDGLSRSAYNDPAAGGKLLPGTLERLVLAPDENGIAWEWQLGNPSPLMAPFLRWRREQGDVEFNKPTGQPRARRYWEVKPAPQATEITRYDVKSRPPVILERSFGQGRVLLFTTRLDAREEQLFPGVGPRSWTNYWENSFGLVLVDKACRYLVGDSVTPDFNYVSGQTVAIPLPREGADRYLLKGPDLSPQGMPLSVPEPKPDEKDRYLPITRTSQPGNYLVLAVRNDRQEVLEGFSLDVRAEESQLTPRIAKEEVEAVLGKDSVLDMQHGMSLKDAISKRPRPVELLPYLMLLLLVFLAVENIVANRSREARPAGAPPGPLPPLEPSAEGGASRARISWRPVVQVVLWTVLGMVIGGGLALWRGGASGSLAAGAMVTGLLGLFHGLLTLARFGIRDGAILGGLLGSMVGVLYGWLILGGPESLLGVLVGMVLGAAVLAADGWLLGMLAQRAASTQASGGR